jgi:hypothetical protein
MTDSASSGSAKPDATALAPGSSEGSVENWLHKQVCADKMTLDEAWKEMQQWPAIFEKLKGHPVLMPSAAKSKSE